MEKNVNIGSSLTKFTFSDADGNVVAYFRMNPADIHIAERAAEVSRYFKGYAEQFTGRTGTEAIAQCDRELSEKVNYLLGYNASETLFGFMSPSTVMEDGKFFVALVMETIAANVGETIKRRYEKFAAVKKYTAKYE